MKHATMKTILAAILFLTATLMGQASFAHGGRVYWGFQFGFPGYWSYPAPYYYPPPYYDPGYYPGYGYPAGPTTYIEQGTQPAPAQPQTNWWYYCAELKAYYPYVKQCPGDWQRVSPTPPGS